MSATLILVYILLIGLVAVGASLLITIGNKAELRSVCLDAKKQTADLKAQIDKQNDALFRGAKQIEDLVKAEGGNFPNATVLLICLNERLMKC